MRHPLSVALASLVVAALVVPTVIEEARDAFEDFRSEPEDFIDAGEVVIVSARISGRGRASGAKQAVHLVHLWALRDGKIIRARIYRTVKEALEAAGLSE